MLSSELSAPAEHHRTTLLKLRPNQCRFIVSDGAQSATCCGAPTASEKSSWCSWHERIVFLSRQPEQERRAA